jgi:hypothetical protein
MGGFGVPHAAAHSLVVAAPEATEMSSPTAYIAHSDFDGKSNTISHIEYSLQSIF